MKKIFLATAFLYMSGCAAHETKDYRDVPVTVIRGHSCTSEITTKASRVSLCPPVMVESDNGTRRWLPIYSFVKPGEKAVLRCDENYRCKDEARTIEN